jgi:hypothetical protein
MNAHLTKNFTTSLNHIRDAYKKANDIFIKGTDRAVAALDTKSASYIDNKKKLLGYAGAMMGLKFDYAAFDRRVSWAQGEIQRYRDQINKIENKTWDENIHAAFAKLADEEKEKLIQDLIELRRAGCAIRECECIDREKMQNAVTDGAGTQARNKIDRENVQALLSGEEPWKEEMEEWEERRRSILRYSQSPDWWNTSPLHSVALGMKTLVVGFRFASLLLAGRWGKGVVAIQYTRSFIKLALCRFVLFKPN